MENRLFKWIAKQTNGIVLKEETDEFRDIDKGMIKTFHLKGDGLEIVHDIEKGKFLLGDHEVYFMINDTLIGKSSDVINYKEKLTTINPCGEQKNSIIGYYTGWKEKSSDFESIEILFWIDMVNQRIKIRATMTLSNPKLLNSVLSVIIDDEVTDIPISFPNINKRERFVFNIGNKL